MLPARIVGHATHTVGHSSLRGARLLLCEGLDAERRGNGKFFLAADWLGAGLGCEVLVTTDGGAAAEKVGTERTPLRNVVLGLIDAETQEVPA